jgi:hypothetical protein
VRRQAATASLEGGAEARGDEGVAASGVGRVAQAARPRLTLVILRNFWSRSAAYNIIRPEIYCEASSATAKAIESLNSGCVCDQLDVNVKGRSWTYNKIMLAA